MRRFTALPFSGDGGIGGYAYAVSALYPRLQGKSGVALAQRGATIAPALHLQEGGICKNRCNRHRPRRRKRTMWPVAASIATPTAKRAT